MSNVSLSTYYEFYEQFTKQSIYSLSLLIFLLLGGCGSKPAPSASTAIANPASDYCVKMGGKLEIIEEESSEKGMCHLPDGTMIEEWARFHRDNLQK